MEFLEIRDDLSSQEILKIIENNIMIGNMCKSELEKINSLKYQMLENFQSIDEKVNEDKNIDLNISTDDDFEDIISYYLEDYMKFSKLFSY